MTPFDFRPTYDASVASRHMAVITKARGMTSPHEDRRASELSDMLRQARMGVAIVRAPGIRRGSVIAFAFCACAVAIVGIVIVAG